VLKLALSTFWSLDMELLGLLAFAGAYFVAVASPGPGVAAIIAQALSGGTKGLPAFIAGFVIGDLVWFTCAATGLALMIKAYAPLFLLIKYAGCAYLLFLAYKLWTSQTHPADGATPRDESNSRLFLGSLALTLGNPKVMLFFGSILPTVVDLQNLTLLGFAELAVIIGVIISLVLTGYALLATRARPFVTSPRTIKKINKASGAALALAAAAIASRPN
jgi:threonine/homoserine/homoserine lactone efflux protein